MSVIAHFTIPADEFALGRLLSLDPAIEVHLESMIPTSETMIPYFWTRNVSASRVEEVLASDPVVTRVTVLDEVGDEALFRVEWSEEINGLIDALRDSHAVIVEAIGSNDVWSLRLRFDDYETLSVFYRTCVQREIKPALERVHNPVDPSMSAERGLTKEQQEAVMAAYELGYYSVPRQVTLRDLGEHLGISDVAASQRLRRGLATLVGATVATHSTGGYE
ncbi:MAG: helix-turn-helix domain-containing protein [Halalkalicoccus sp.]